MANIINGTDTGSGGLITTGDSSDELQLQTAETARVTLTNTAVVVNEDGNDVDFRVESDTNANALFVEGSSGNVGIGTSSPNQKLNVAGAIVSTAQATALVSSSSFFDYIPSLNIGRVAAVGNTTGTAAPVYFSQYSSDGSVGRDAAIIDSSGNVGIGLTSPAETFLKSGSLDANGVVVSRGALAANQTNAAVFQYNGNATSIRAYGATGGTGFITFNVGGGGGSSDFEAVRLDVSGNFLVGTTSSGFGVGVGFKVLPDGRTGCVVNDATTGTNTYHFYNDNATNNGYRFYVNVNGGIYNYSGNNVNLSDERMKTNIEVAGGYLEKICAIPVKLFNYKDEQEGEQKTLGVIAQDVESVAPEFVNNDGWEGNNPEDGTPLKTIYTTDMMFGMMKAIQELKAELDTVKAELATLKG